MTPALRHCAFLLAVCLLALACIPLVLAFVKRWLFDVRCSSLRTFDYSGFDRAAALLRYSGEIIAATGEGIAVPCDSQRLVEMWGYHGHKWFIENHKTFKRLTFAKQRWCYENAVHDSFCRAVSVSRQTAIQVIEECGLEASDSAWLDCVVVRVRFDLLLVHDDREASMLDRELRRIATAKMSRAIDAIAEYAR